VAASGLLHFYYDGFIWKVRERSTRESLGLTGGTTSNGSTHFFPGWLVHGSKWVAAFVIPLGALWIGQTRGPAPTLQRAEWIVADIPVGSMPRCDYAASLKEAGRLDEAAAQLRIGLRYNPKDEKAHYTLANVLIHQSKVDEAAAHLERALQLDPRVGDFHSDYGYILEQEGRKNEALAQYKSALRLSPKSALAHYNYAMFLGREAQPGEAATEFQRALQINPQYADAHYDFGNLLYGKDDLKGAKQHYLAAIRVAPRRGSVHNMLGIVLMRQGQTSQAILQFAEALQLAPNDNYAAENLRRAQAIDARLGAGSALPR
jgi:tetratricopeptide (TPR) repeat protein